MSKILALTSGKNRKENIRKVLNLIKSDLPDFSKKSNILVKPNLTAVTHTYANTAVEAIETVIEFLNENYAVKKITVADISGTAYYKKVSTWEALKNFGYDKLPQKYKNVVVETYEDAKDYIEIPIDTIVGKSRVRIVKKFQEFDYKFSVVPPKTHNFAITTLGIKNMAGFVKSEDMALIHGMRAGKEVDAPKTILDRLPDGTVSRLRRKLPAWVMDAMFLAFPDFRRSIRHIHKNILAFSKVLWPDAVIIDGLYGMEKDGPIDGIGIEHNMAIASADALKADCACARAMGINPMDVGYLYYMAQEKMGESSLENIAGEKLENIIKHYRLHGTYSAQRNWKK